MLRGIPIRAAGRSHGCAYFLPMSSLISCTLTGVVRPIMLHPGLTVRNRPALPVGQACRATLKTPVLVIYAKAIMPVLFPYVDPTLV